MAGLPPLGLQLAPGAPDQAPLRPGLAVMDPCYGRVGQSALAQAPSTPRRSLSGGGGQHWRQDSAFEWHGAAFMVNGPGTVASNCSKQSSAPASPPAARCAAGRAVEQLFGRLVACDMDILFIRDPEQGGSVQQPAAGGERLVNELQSTLEELRAGLHSLLLVRT